MASTSPGTTKLSQKALFSRRLFFRRVLNVEKAFFEKQTKKKRNFTLLTSSSPLVFAVKTSSKTIAVGTHRPTQLWLHARANWVSSVLSPLSRSESTGFGSSAFGRGIGCFVLGSSFWRFLWCFLLGWGLKQKTVFVVFSFGFLGECFYGSFGGVFWFL